MTVEAIGLAILSGVFGLLVGFMLGDWRAWLERKLSDREHFLND
jgi:hypothetical protein